MHIAWWFRWKADLNLFIKCCPKGESFHRVKPPKQTTLHATHAGQPGEKLANDLCGLFPPVTGTSTF